MITRDQDTELNGDLQETEGIQSVEKALAVLDALADRSGRYPATLAELTRRTGFHRSSVNRCIISLVKAGYVLVDQSTQRYQLGPKVLRLAQHLAQQSDILVRSRQHLVQLRDATEETAFLSLLVGDKRIAVAQEESRLGLRRSMEIGIQVSLHCSAASKAILAFAPAELVDRVLGGTLEKCGPGSTSDSGELRSQLRLISEKGYAIGQDEIVEGAGAVCAPVFDHQNIVMGSIGIAGPAVRLTPDREPELAAAVVEAARALSFELGHDGVK